LSNEDHTANLAPAWRANLVGRLALWSMSVFLTSTLLAGLTSALWLLTPLADQGWFVCVHRVVLAISLGSFTATFVVLFVLHRWLVGLRDVSYRSLKDAKVHVALTAYNDEDAIGPSVRDFKANPRVHKVIVVENNSKDDTKQAAKLAGADEVVTEKVPGYGSCCQRCLAEAAKDLSDSDVIILCEGDMTFSGADVDKFLAYLENCDLVLGTRATQELRQRDTQMDWLINPANQVVAKLIQTRFWGTRLTDVGCTYRAMRVDAYRKLQPKLRILGNHFSPHMYMEALKLQMRVIEVPIVFKVRMGVSKGVGSNKQKAAKVATRMLLELFKA